MKRRQRVRDEEETTYWLSYSDMMAALLLTFVLIISFTMLQAKKNYEEKESLLENQSKELAQQKEMIEEQQKKIDELTGVKTNLIETLMNEFKGTDLKVMVDSKSGSIAVDSNILFDYNNAQLKSSGKNFLNDFLPKYLSVLTSDEYEDYIAEIIIEGHTDSNGDYLYNLELSQKRAMSVASYCLDTSKGIMGEEDVKLLRTIIAANGKSYSEPVLLDNGKEDEEASRRVEVKFRLKNEELLDEMSKLLDSADDNENNDSSDNINNENTNANDDSTNKDTKTDDSVNASDDNSKDANNINTSDNDSSSETTNMNGYANEIQNLNTEKEDDDFTATGETHQY